MILPPAQILGIFFALTAAFVWGGSDFTGGYASRRSSQFQVLVLSALSGLVILILAAILWRESFPSAPGILWSVLAGACGAVGLAALYRALSTGEAASVAPTAAVVGAALPVLYSGLTEGIPASTKLIGFGLALAGIWVVSAASNATGEGRRRGYLLAFLAGVGFAGFFICLSQVEAGKVFTPLIIARCLTFLIGLVAMRLQRLPLPAITSNPPALLAGLLDAGGNLFFLLSMQFTRLDISVVLASLYPATTVVLAGMILRQKVNLVQWIGVAICLAAIVLITA